MPRQTRSADVLGALRAATAAEHRQVEDALALLDPGLDRGRLAAVLARLHAFWVVAEAGLEVWARREPVDAEAVCWPGRRRAHVFAADLRELGAVPAGGQPLLAAVEDTDQALGRLYVLEGSTLGGAFIDRHLATLPDLAGVPRPAAFSPYGERTGSMWAAYRRVTRERVAAGGDAARIVGAACDTFTALAGWCEPVSAAPARAGGRA